MHPRPDRQTLCVEEPYGIALNCADVLQAEGERVQSEFGARYGGVKTLGDLKALEPGCCHRCPEHADGCERCYERLLEFGFDKSGVHMVQRVFDFVDKVRE
eukprot:SAG31_NODE_14819_length_786_cov_0.732169_2_plen_101_part_00